MRLFLDQTDKIDYFEIVLSKEEKDMLPMRCILKEYISPFDGNNTKKTVSVLVRTETTSMESYEAIKDCLQLEDYL